MLAFQITLMTITLHNVLKKKIKVGMGHHGSGHRDRQEIGSSSSSSFSFQPSHLTAVFGAGHHGSGHRRDPNLGNYPSSSVTQNTVVVMPPAPQPTLPSIIAVLAPPPRLRPQIIHSYHQLEPRQQYYLPTSATILHNSGTTPTVATSTIPIHQQSQETEPCCHDCCHMNKPSEKHSLCMVFWLLIASFCAVFLVTTIGLQQHQIFVLNPGETRRVVPPNPTFYKSLSIEYSPYSQPVESNIQVKTYFYPQQDCPQLSGPSVSLYTTNDLNLAYGDYEYDYFYLNAGSHITVSMESFTQGSANVLLFRGQTSFDSWCSNHDFAARPLVKRQAASGVVGTILEYTVPTADTYYVVAENPYYFKQLVATQAVMVQATSYDLSDQFQVTPSPSGIATVNLHQQNGNSCIIVQVTSATTSINVSGYDVTIYVHGHRRWVVLYICACILALLFLLCCTKAHSKIVSNQSQSASCDVTHDIIQYTPVPQQPPELDPEIPVVEATLVHEPPVPSAPPLDALDK
jgi:hypothetical protein